MNRNFLIIFCLFFTYSTHLFSQIVNEGTFHIESSTLVYFGDEYTNNGTHNNNGDLFLNNNFINNDSTSATSGTTYFKSSVNDIQTISGSTGTINFYNLEVDNSLKGVQVVDNFGLFVENSISLVNGGLRLIGEAQLVQSHIGTNVNTAVSGNLLRDQQGNYSSYGYNYWSSPVNNNGTFSLSAGLFDGTDSDLQIFEPKSVLFNSGSPFNGLPSVLSEEVVFTGLTLNRHWFFKYARGNASVASWIKIDENSPVSPGEAYIMKGTNTSAPTQNYVFKGVPNDGLYQFPIDIDEYLLLGNPYPSAMDVDEFIKQNISISEGGYAANDAINGTLYYWVEGGSTSHSYSGYYGGYATRNLTSGAPPSVSPISVGGGLGSSEFALPPTQYMAIAQGFFVEGASNSNIVFKNSQRIFKTEASGESLHYKSTNQKNSQAKSIVRIGYEDPEGFHRQLVLGFLPNSKADLSYNKPYDAKMFGEREDELYFIIENDLINKYVIQGVNAFDESMAFPLGLKITEEGKHNIMLDATENFNHVVYIKDNFLNTTHNLTESKLELNVSAGIFSDRFQLVFQPQSTLDIDEFERNQINVYYNGDHSIIINNQNGLSLYKVSIYNILGQKILRVNDSSLGKNKIMIPFRKKEGVYFVRIESEIGEATFKILKNK